LKLRGEACAVAVQRDTSLCQSLFRIHVRTGEATTHAHSPSLTPSRKRTASRATD
jgi:hypothetical protein